MSTGGYIPTYQPQTTAASSSTKYPVSSHETERFGYLCVSGISQHDQHQPPYKARGNLPQDSTQLYYIRSTCHGSGDGLHLLPSSSVRSADASTRAVPITTSSVPFILLVHLYLQRTLMYLVTMFPLFLTISIHLLVQLTLYILIFLYYMVMYQLVNQC